MLAEQKKLCVSYFCLKISINVKRTGDANKENQVINYKTLPRCVSNFSELTLKDIYGDQ